MHDTLLSSTRVPVKWPQTTQPTRRRSIRDTAGDTRKVCFSQGCRQSRSRRSSVWGAVTARGNWALGGGDLVALVSLSRHCSAYTPTNTGVQSIRYYGCSTIHRGTKRPRRWSTQRRSGQRHAPESPRHWSSRWRTGPRLTRRLALYVPRRRRPHCPTGPQRWSHTRDPPLVAAHHAEHRGHCTPLRGETRTRRGSGVATQAWCRPESQRLGELFTLLNPPTRLDHRD